MLKLKKLFTIFAQTNVYLNLCALATSVIFLWGVNMCVLSNTGSGQIYLLLLSSFNSDIVTLLCFVFLSLYSIGKSFGGFH